MLPYCLNYGLSLNDFYCLTLTEVTRFLEVHFELLKNRNKEKASYDYNLAYLTGIATHLEPPENYPGIYEAYAGVFDKTDIRGKSQEDWKISKEKFKEYARMHNKDRKEENRK